MLFINLSHVFPPLFSSYHHDDTWRQVGIHLNCHMTKSIHCHCVHLNIYLYTMVVSPHVQLLLFPKALKLHKHSSREHAELRSHVILTDVRQREREVKVPWRPIFHLQTRHSRLLKFHGCVFNAYTGMTVCINNKLNSQLYIKFIRNSTCISKSLNVI